MEQDGTIEYPNRQNEPAKVFVTGANGLLGSHITRELLRRNLSVVAFTEKGSEAKTIADLPGVQIVYGDILDGREIIQASEACSFIIHAAASTAVVPARSKHINAVNIDGTQNVIIAAEKNKVKRLVYVGSATTFGFGSIENPGTESRAFCSAKFGLDYIDSKFQAHQQVLHAVKNRDLPAIIVCPTFMFGKYDSKPGSGDMLVSVYNKKVPGYSYGGKNYVYAGDVATAVVNALSMGRVGEAYILGHRNLDYKSAFHLIAQTLEVKCPVLPLPKPVVLAYGVCCSF